MKPRIFAPISFFFLLLFASSLYLSAQEVNYSLVYVQRLKKSTNAGETYKIFLNDQSAGKLDGINLAVSSDAKGKWLVNKYVGSDRLTLRVMDTKDKEIDRIQLEAAPGRSFYVEFNPAAGYGVKPLRLLPNAEGHDAFRMAALNTITIMPKDLEKTILAKKDEEAPPDDVALNVQISANQGQTEDVAFVPTDQNRSNFQVNSKTGTGFIPGAGANKYFALIIGVQDYLDPAINDLDQPVKDAQSFYDVLVNFYTFDKKNVIYMVNPKREEMTKAFDKLVETISAEDNLLIFYAGHGHWDEKLKQGYWLPADALQGNRGSWFSNADLKTYIGGINARHTLLVTDACFGGGIFKTREAFPDATTDIQELYKYPSRKAMTSGSLNVVPDKSVFIEYMVKRLQLNKDKYLSSEQLFASFKTAVINNSANSQIPQFGEIRETGDEGGDFIFIKK
jgi:hypothetical protein